jgi:dienelactone hydrolase
VRYLIPLLLAAALAGCGSSKKASAPPAPSLASTCGTIPAGLHATTSWLRTSDGLRLYSATSGSGNTAVVLSHESGGAGLCGWLPTMRWLAAHGFEAVAFDFRGTSPSPLPPQRIAQHWWHDVQAAVDAAHAKTVVVMGASFGGAEAVADGWRYRGVDGIVSLSGELDLPTSGLDAYANASRLRVPLLVVASAVDGYLDAADARRLVRRAASADTQLAIFPGRTHGWDILDTEPAARKVVLEWLRQRRR